MAGGIAFTGVFSSFWNLNIFEKPEYLAATVFFAVLPDVDHTKSPIGKAFYPLAKWIDTKYGHRTITHSLVCCGALYLLIALLSHLFLGHQHFTIIYFFAYFSHLTFDMMTVQGVPLLWPFLRNPCVIPANRDYRFRVSNLKTESVIFAVFIMLNLVSYPLMSKGFWTTYNQSFGRIRHLHREYLSAEDLLEVKYSFFTGHDHYEGTALLVSSEPEACVLFDKDHFIHLDRTTPYEFVEPIHSGQLYRIREAFFYDITYDSLQHTLRDKITINAQIQSNTKIKDFTPKVPSITSVLKWSYVYNPRFISLTDSLDDQIVQQITLKQIELKEVRQDNTREQAHYQELQQQLLQLRAEYPAADLYRKEVIQKEIQKLETKVKNFTFTERSTAKLQQQLQHLLDQQQLTQQASSFTGYISYLEILSPSANPQPLTP